MLFVCRFGLGRRWAGRAVARWSTPPLGAKQTALLAVGPHGLRLTPADTLAALTSAVSSQELDHATNQAQARRLVPRTPDGFTRSEAERLLLRLIDQARLPRPRTNVRLHGYEVDFLWPEQRLVVEVDGFEFHRSRAAFESDRARDADLLLAGYRVLRITWRQLTKHPHAVVARLAGALAA